MRAGKTGATSCAPDSHGSLRRGLSRPASPVPRRAARTACSSSGESCWAPLPESTTFAYVRVSVRPLIELSTTPSPAESSSATENESWPDDSRSAS